MSSITIPSSVSTIEGWAFYGCSGLTSITCLPTTLPDLENENAFGDTNDCPIYVPSEAYDEYTAQGGIGNWLFVRTRIQPLPNS